LGEQLLSLAQRLQDSDFLLEAHHTLWTTLLSGGELAAAWPHLEQGMMLYAPQRHRTHAALYSGHDPGVCCRMQAAHSLWLLGYPDQAMASIQAALALAQQLAHPLSLSMALLAETFAQVGQITKGLEALAEGLATVAKSRVRWWEAELYRLRGELLLQQTVAQPEEAEVCFQQALAVARREQAKSWELRAAMSLSLLWRRQGKRGKAHQLLAEVYGWFTEGFDTADLREARALLHELA